jgi:hypothetical protein
MWLAYLGLRARCGRLIVQGVRLGGVDGSLRRALAPWFAGGCAAMIGASSGALSAKKIAPAGSEAPLDHARGAAQTIVNPVRATAVPASGDTR